VYSDSALSSSINNSNAYLDFYQYHWYPWQTQWFESPFTQTTEEYQVDDRPVIVGESEGNDVCDDYFCQTVVEMYENAYKNGFDGVCAWKTPQNDGHGTFENIAEATNAFYQNHPTLVYPDGSTTVAVTGVSLSESSIIVEENQTYQLSATVTPSNASDKRVSWTTGNTNVASVENGLVTGIAIGNTTIIVETNDGSFTDSCVVEVKEKESSCNNPTSITLTFKHDGAGEYCWVTSDDIEKINSWNTNSVEINGVDYTNQWSNSMPDKIDGKYYISFNGDYPWSHFEAHLKESNLKNNKLNDIAVYPGVLKDQPLIIEGPGILKGAKVDIYSISGQVVYQGILDPGKTILAKGLFPNKGIFLIKITQQTARKVYKIIVE
jgi:hypothetical protein